MSVSRRTPAAIAIAIAAGAAFGVLAQISDTWTARAARPILMMGWSWGLVGLIAAQAARTYWGKLATSLCCLEAAVCAFYLYRVFFDPFYVQLAAQYRPSIGSRIMGLLEGAWGLWLAAGAVWALIAAGLMVLYRKRRWSQPLIWLGCCALAIQSALASPQTITRPTTPQEGTQLAILIIASVIVAVMIVVTGRNVRRRNGAR